MFRHPNESAREYRNRRAKKRGKLFDKIAQIFFENDPICINLEENIDEYELEANKLVRRLKKVTSIETLKQTIIEQISSQLAARSSKSGVC